MPPPAGWRLPNPAVALLLLTATAHATRVPLADSNMPAAAPPQELALVDAFPGLTFSQPLGITAPPGETNRLFIIEKEGDIELIPDLLNPSRTLFLNLDSVVNARPSESFPTSGEQGLLGLAFHPDYANNRRFFVCYTVNINGSRHQRLSGFTTQAGNPDAADTGSETILIEQFNDRSNHNGGDLHFGPDGYLYMSWGDEGAANDTRNNSQTITKDFWSSIMRIDVDLEPEDYTATDGTGDDDANLPPNAHAAVVTNGAGHPNYEVPADNPWVGATSFLGQSVTPSAVRTEFWAVGLRNPWRMSFDPQTGDLWCADVGQNAREEINLITRGGNYEWAFREGFLTGAKWSQRPSGWTGADPPVWDYPRSEGYSVTGGVVYRGNNIPELQGRYIFADYGSGNIWSLDNSGAGPVVERLAGEAGIAGFGYDPSNGDVLMADLNNGLIRRLTIQTTPGPFPDTLAATGLFSNPTTLTPSPGLEPYDINLPFWSDHAIKTRWFGHPDPAPTFGWAQDDPWSLPTGTIWVKHFELETERGNPATRKRIETRVLVKTTDGSYGVSYRWNEAGTAATLADAAGETFDLAITDGGQPATQRWRIPSHAECLLCHAPQAGHTLSFNTRQLNRPGTLGGTSGNFLSLLASSGYLTGLTADPATLPRHVAPDETAYALESRARSWLEVNCAYCHSDTGTVPAAWDARAHLALFDTGLVNGPAEGSLLDPADRLLVPGEEHHSLIVHRAAARNGYTRMPPLATFETDDTAIQLLIDWIESELPGRQSYDAWREMHFATSPDGAPGLDPDLDGRDNHTEFLALTNPTAADSPPAILFERTGTTLSLTHPDLPGRGLLLESSTNLTDWIPWPATGNDGLARPAGSPTEFTTPINELQRFFRTRIEER